MAPDLNHVRIILVEPEGAFNIGSVARIMKNMGLRELALVSPAEFLNDDGYKSAVGARDVLENALVFERLEDALNDANLVVGTTRRAGKLRRLFCSVEELPEKVFPVLAEGRVAILFGREKDGLTNRETDLCSVLVNIPSSESFPSLNLSHAVAVVCYKLFIDAMIFHVPYISRPAANAEIEGLLDYIEIVFTDVGFFSKGSPRYVISLFRKIFGRALLDEEEIENLTYVFHRLHGLLKENKVG
jgi:tRNA/rRNA methyltransferase